MATKHNLSTVAGLQPSVLLKHFSIFASIPRPSFKEQRVKQVRENVVVVCLVRDHSTHPTHPTTTHSTCGSSVTT